MTIHLQHTRQTDGRYDIRVEHKVSYRGKEVWVAVEDQRYDADGDSEGYYPNYAQATGNSKWDAVESLVEQLKRAEIGE